MLEKIIQYFIIKKSNYFDKNFYLTINPEIRDSQLDPLMHYIRQGWKENRDPGPNFSTSWYLKTYNDVKNAGINPLFHYLKYGKKEGRKIKSLPEINKNSPHLLNNKPVDLMIIGAQRAGTTSLFRFLDSIPNFSGSKDKELGFFSLDKRYNKGIEWYQQQFELCYRNQLRFEATPEYLYYPFVPHRVKNYREDIKIIVILRNPIERCYSAWKLFRSLHKFDKTNKYNIIREANPAEKKGLSELLMREEYPTFEEVVENDLNRYYQKCEALEPSFVRRGLYYHQISTWLQYFDLSQFLFLENKELSKINLICNKLEIFLNIDLDPSLKELRMPKENKLEGKVNSEIDKEVIGKLRDFYQDHNEKLYKLLGKQYDWD